MFKVTQTATGLNKGLTTLALIEEGAFAGGPSYASCKAHGAADGTLIVAVQVHSVLVTDLVKHITVVVHAGQHYLAHAPQ